MKNQILQFLIPNLEQSSLIRAAWLGGSKATGLEDELSDLDVVMVGSEPEKIFEYFESVISGHFEIDQVWKPEATSPYHQKFYTLKNTPQTFYLDVVVFTHSKLNEYFNTARHGTPYILFDKDKVLESCAKAPTSETPVLDPQNELAKFEILHRTFLKEAARGKFIDSYTFYQRLVATFIHLKRLHYTPQKHDFGFRYIYTDFPKHEHAFIESLLQVTTIEGMIQKARTLKQEFEKLTH